jgi:hypothetical protein
LADDPAMRKLLDELKWVVGLVHDLPTEDSANTSIEQARAIIHKPSIQLSDLEDGIDNAVIKSLVKARPPQSVSAGLEQAGLDRAVPSSYSSLLRRMAIAAGLAAAGVVSYGLWNTADQGARTAMKKAPTANQLDGSMGTLADQLADNSSEFAQAQSAAVNVDSTSASNLAEAMNGATALPLQRSAIEGAGFGSQKMPSTAPALSLSESSNSQALSSNFPDRTTSPQTAPMPAQSAAHPASSAKVKTENSNQGRQAPDSGGRWSYFRSADAWSQQEVLVALDSSSIAGLKQQHIGPLVVESSNGSAVAEADLSQPLSETKNEADGKSSSSVADAPMTVVRITDAIYKRVVDMALSLKISSSLAANQDFPVNHNGPIVLFLSESDFQRLRVQWEGGPSPVQTTASEPSGAVSVSPNSASSSAPQPKRRIIILIPE